MANVFRNDPPGVTRGQAMAALAAGDWPIAASAIVGLTSWWPSLAISSLDFRNSRFMVRGGATVNFSDVVTFTRSGAGTYFDSAGVLQSASTDTARYPVYDSGDDTNTGFLVEPAATNLLQSSADLADATQWTKTNTTVSSNTTAAPNGTTTADTVTANAGTTVAHVNNVATVSTGVYVQSVFAKAGTYDYLWVGDRGDAAGVRCATFNLSTGAVMGASNGAGYIEDIGGGIYRCSLVYTRANAGTASGMYGFANSSHTADIPSLTWAGTETLIMWGAQLEAIRLTSYIPTTTATVTRGADVATVTSMSGYAAASNRSFAGVVSGRTPTVLPAASASYVIRQMDDGTEDNRVRLEWYNDAGTGKLRLVVTSGGVAQTAPLVVGNVAIDTDFKVAYSVEDNDVLASLDGATAVTDTTATSPTGLTTDRIGRNSSDAEYWSGTIKEITNFRTLSAAEAEVLSV